MNTGVHRVAVVGGGPVAWIAASAIARAFRHRRIQVAVLDTGLPPDAPVGRWTLPSQRGMHGLLGLSEGELIAKTGATYKLATEHLGFQGTDSRLLHAHGEIGQELGGIAFYKYLLMQRVSGHAESAEPYSIAAVAARLGRFARPMGESASLTASFTYGFHLDEAAYTQLLREQAMRLSIRRHQSSLSGVDRDAVGNVTALRLSDGESIVADFFLDASGAAAELFRAIGSDDARDDWRAWFPCDRVLCGFGGAAAEPPPLTRTNASSAGWTWRMPLARASVVGYAYASAHLGDDAAHQELRTQAPDLQDTPRLTRLSPGRRRDVWAHNCVAVGSAAVELEPLAGADLHLAQIGIGTLIEIFPLDADNREERVEYNRIMGEHADALRDFTLAHYRAGAPRMGEFWNATRAAPSPDRLAHKLEQFGATGRLTLLDHESFEEMDWAWLLLGAGVVPDAVELQTATRLAGVTDTQVAPLRAHIQQLVSSMPRHIEYVQRLAMQSAHAAKP